MSYIGSNLGEYFGEAANKSASIGQMGDLQLTSATGSSTWEKILSGVSSGIRAFLGTTTPGYPAGAIQVQPYVPTSTASSMVPLLLIGGVVLFLAMKKH
jgi:hypothetical protein